VYRELVPRPALCTRGMTARDSIHPASKSMHRICQGIYLADESLQSPVFGLMG
jgi:hypothetical protein